jgi:tRNA 5-methylaminomethyl-2-thiouridine biosynthesis bifunctional protein
MVKAVRTFETELLSLQMVEKSIPSVETTHPQRHITIIGAGLAGVACAQVFAQRGFEVTVWESANTCAAAASGVPVALFAPSVSADDAPHSRLLRRGVQTLVTELQRLSQDALLKQGQDWCLSGVQERNLRTAKRLPGHWRSPVDVPEQQSRYLPQLNQHGVHAALWHGMAGWVKPARLVQAWLTHPGIHLQTQQTLTAPALHQLLHHSSTQAVVLATGADTGALLFDYFQAEQPALAESFRRRLQTIRGQVQWGLRSELVDHLHQRLEHADPLSPAPAAPINGQGQWVTTPDRWLVGATFQRDDIELKARDKDRSKLLAKLNELLPELPPTELSALFAQGSPWVGLRAAQKNRQPWLGQIDVLKNPKLWICAGLGSRGLSLSLLCAQTLANEMQQGLKPPVSRSLRGEIYP